MGARDRGSPGNDGTAEADALIRTRSFLQTDTRLRTLPANAATYRRTHQQTAVGTERALLEIDALYRVG